MCSHRCFSIVLCISSVLAGLFLAQQAQAYTEYLCADGSYHYSCQTYDGWKCQDGSVVSNRTSCNSRGGTITRVVPVCGDGVIDPGEACDNGERNSDLQRNACRTDCRLPYCGDGVLDSGEMCDDGSGNNNNPNSCRPNCRLPVCGDGIHDNGAHLLAEFNEECDDGNNNESDGCKTDCTTCLQLTGNIEVTTDTKLCQGVFKVGDYGDEGVIIVKYPGITIDCDGATLQGTGVGAGIFVKMCNDVMIRNCTISGYAAGVKAVQSQNLRIQLDGSDFSNNGQEIVLEDSTKLAFYSEGVHTEVGAIVADVKVVPSKDKKSMQPQTVTTPAKKPTAQSRSATTKPLTVAPQALTPKSTTSRKMVVPEPHGTVVSKSKRTYLDLNVSVKRADIYAGKRRLGSLKGGKRLDISAFVRQANRGELIIHYFDSRGVKTVQKITVTSNKK